MILDMDEELANVPIVAAAYVAIDLLLKSHSNLQRDKIISSKL